VTVENVAFVSTEIKAKFLGRLKMQDWN